MTAIKGKVIITCAITGLGIKGIAEPTFAG